MTRREIRGMRAALLAALFHTTLISITSAQEAAPAAILEEVRLADGSRLIGRAVSETADSVYLETMAGAQLAVAKYQIQSRRPTSGRVVEGSFWEEDPNATRLLFAPTARPLRRGEGYVSSFMIVLPFVAYAVSDRVTIAGGTPIIPGAMGQVFYVAPKVTLFDGDRVDLATGVLSFFSVEDGAESLGIGYGVATVGDPDNALTFGAGWGYMWGGGEREVSSEPVIMVAGETRVSSNVKLISENWFAGGGELSLLSGGVRFIGDRLSADLGLGALVDGGCCIPLVNFVYNFGQR